MKQSKASTMMTNNLSVRYGNHLAVDKISLSIESGQVTAIIGPSGCGKSTFIRCLNRMHDFIADVHVEGEILLHGVDIYGASVDPVSIRRRVGMVFQKANPFPHMSIVQNVLSGFSFTRKKTTKSKEEIAETALRNAALFDEVKDRLNAPSGALSGGQQQRLCIARALAMEPEVLLLDEPCSALDPISTARIEDLIHTLRTNYAIVIVTHNMQQAARVSQVTAYFLSGKLVEMDETKKLFTNPADQRTEDYITGEIWVMTKNHTNRAFDNDLRILRDRILLIAGRVEKMVANSIKSLSENDAALARKTIDYDRSIDSDEAIIDRMSIELLAQRQPVGQDLRFIVSVIKMVTYFERLGDLAVKICQRVIELRRLEQTYDVGDITNMAKSVQAMIKEMLEAFLERDYEKAMSVIAQDDAIDELYHLITKRLISEMSTNIDHAENYYHLLSIAKWLERMGDHCTNLAEIIIYMIKGEDVRHKHVAVSE